MNTWSDSLHGIAGIDEAGRGPMIGPLVICGVLFDPESIATVTAAGVKDSKVLSTIRRELLSDVIRGCARAIVFEKITAKEIDDLRRQGVNLNETELKSFTSIAKELSPLELYVDAVDVDQDRFGTKLGERSGLEKLGCKIVSEHKADSKYPVVSAASILAKVERDQIISDLHKIYGDFGSGYPSDPKSIEFVQRYIESGSELPDIVRTSWESIARLGYQRGTVQTKLDD